MKREKRKIVHKKVSGKCPKCGTYRERLQRDHIKPLCFGGSNHPKNIQYICANCHEDKTRLEISLALKGRKVSAETCLKISLANKGRKLSKEHILKIRNRKHTPEARLKMSKAHRGRPWSIKRKLAQKKRGNYKLSKKWKRKISKSLEGRLLSDSCKNKIRCSKLGRKNPMYGKSTKGFTGQHHTKEAKTKISLSMRNRIR